MPPVKQMTPKARTPTSKRPSGGVLDKIKPIGYGDDDPIKILLYGRSGTGKTTLWGTFPGKTLALVCSGGGELRSIDDEDRRGRVETLTLDSVDDFRQLVEAVEANEYPVDNVVLDHVTGFSDLVLKEILNLDDLPAQKSFGMASQQDYGQLGIQLKTLLRSLIRLPCNVVVIGQERTFGGGEDGGGSDLIQPTVGAALTPTVAGWLNTAVDYVCQTFIRNKVKVSKAVVAGKTVTNRTKTDEPEYCLRIGAHPVYHGKFRKVGGVKAGVIVDPTYDKIMSLVRGEAAADATDEE